MNQILAMAETRRSLGVRSFFINEAKNTLFVEIENLSPEKESQFRMGVLDAPFFLFENRVPETLSIPYETVAEATTPTNPDMVFSKEQLENMYAMLNGKE